MSTDPAADAQKEVAELVARSRAAQAQIEHYTQEQVDDLITAVVWSVCQEETAKTRTPASPSSFVILPSI